MPLGRPAHKKGNMPEILEYSTCNVCLEIAERTWYFESPDGLKFEICLACLKSAQQMFALDGELPCLTCGGEVGHRINCPHGIAFTSVPRK